MDVAAPRWPLLIVYGSQTGNARDAAELLGREAAARQYAARVLSADACSAASLFTAPLLLFVVATAGQARPLASRASWPALTARPGGGARRVQAALAHAAAQGAARGRAGALPRGCLRPGRQRLS